ncbi:uncharacterized protein EV422DRAFT_526179 [Fimicolochytrium jonesii]|uniref:uncharacterized protein n=1 Tax=Fimicolochytrium jonesii TaxID=1396493 RepID=UPI0022FEBAE4|nr:uncharacterized protein EV422DRAFT_526179 [Fimicolochytrium jonesii]KAI8822242.1 hypothetical protein EV422DRAFT_526179 [Fimicolochytrium jonesii]
MTVRSYRDLVEKVGTSCLADLSPGKIVVIYAVVTSFKPPRKTNGTDHVLNVSLADPSLSSSRADDLGVNIFHRREELPAILGTGQVLKLRVKVQMYNNKMQGLNPKFDSYLAETLEDATARSLGEREILASLRDWWAAESAPLPHGIPAATNPIPRPMLQGKRPTLQIDQVKTANHFCDMFAQVVYLYPVAPNGQQITTLLTDYTENLDLGLPDSLPPSICIPATTSLLACTLWDEHVERMQNVQAGTFIFLRNLRIKPGRFGLEAAMHGTRQPGESKYGVTVLDADDPGLEALHNRKELLLASFNRDRSSRPTSPPSMILPPPPPLAAKPFTPLSSVIASRGGDEVFRCNVKIIDHLPRDVKDFARRTCRSCVESSGPRDPACEACASSHSYAFCFSLMLVDETACIPATITHGAAEQCLRIRATDLSSNPVALAQVAQTMQSLVPLSPQVADGHSGGEVECHLMSSPIEQAGPRYRIVRIQN